MNAALSPHASCAAGLFSFCLLDGLPVGFRRPYVQQAPAGCGHKRLATALMTIRVPQDGEKKITDTTDFGSWKRKNRLAFRVYDIGVLG